MRLHLLVSLTFVAPLAPLVAACQTPVDSAEQSLIARCTATPTTPTANSVVIGGGGGGSDGGSPGGGGGSGTGSGSGLPTSPDACPVCRDVHGNPLPASACTVHVGVCEGVSGNPGGSAVLVSQTLAVVQPASGSPAVAYYGACDGHGHVCEQRDFAYELAGNELAVATFGTGTTVYAIPAGATAVRAHEPIFPLLPASAGFHNPAVHVVFRSAAGATVDGYGDMQNDCRVVADDGSQPPSGIPCWCTQC